jgi:glutaredoxin
VTVVTLYGKPGCHLCEDARATVVAVRAEVNFELREVDVASDPRLHAKYGDRIPVVAVDGEELAEHFVEPDALRRAVDRVDS